jgi:hypothetical protein
MKRYKRMRYPFRFICRCCGAITKKRSGMRRYCTSFCRLVAHDFGRLYTGTLKVSQLTPRQIRLREYDGVANRLAERMYIKLYSSNLVRIDKIHKVRAAARKSMAKFRAGQAMRLDNELR